MPLTSITTRVFLGQQIQCTQCHDHPSNDWKQADFWGINAFFKGIKTRGGHGRPTRPASRGRSTTSTSSDEPTDAFASYDKRNGLVGIAFPKFLDGRKISQGKDVDRRVELGKFITDPKNRDLARAFVNRMWGHFMGRGFVQPGRRLRAAQPAEPSRAARQAGAGVPGTSDYDIKALIRWIMNSQAYNLSSVMTKDNEKDETLFSHMTLKPMTPEQLFDSLLTATAAHKAGGRQRRQASATSG